MHAPIPTVFSLFFLPLSFILSVLFILSFLLLSCHQLFPLRSFLFFGPSLGASPSKHLPQVLPPPLGTSFVSSMATSSFYSEHIQWEFSFFTPRASPTIFGLLWTFLQDYPPTYWMPSYDLCLEYVYCTTSHFMTKFSFVCSCCIPLPLGSNG